MNLIVELIISVVVCLVIFLPLAALRNKLRYSFKPTEGVTMDVTIHAKGGAACLEHAVAAAVRELARAPFISRVVIEDMGLDSEARTLAEILCVENENVYISEDPEWMKLKDNLI